MANASSMTVSFSDEKNSTIFLMSIGIFGGLHELDQRVLLLRHDVRVAHELVKPGLAAERQHHADNCAGLPVRASVPENSTSVALPPDASIVGRFARSSSISGARPS